MIDVSKTCAPKSDQLNADDLISGPITIKITKVAKSDAPDQPISIFFEGDNGKPYKPCKSMRRVLVAILGKDGTKYVGHQLTLYRDEKVKFGGAEVGGIRISHMTGITEKKILALTETRAKRKPHVVMPISGVKIAPPEPAVDVEASEELLAAGEEAATGGVEAYKAWLSSLDADDKESIRTRHKAWSALAKKADDERKPEDEIPLDDESPAM